MTHSTPDDLHLIDISPQPRLVDFQQSPEAENQWLRAKVFHLQQQLATKPSAPKSTEWLAAVLGAIGALLLSTNFHPGWGFAWFLASNAVWIRYALRARAFGLLAQQLVFTGTSLCGLWVWWLGALFTETKAGAIVVAILSAVAGTVGPVLAWLGVGLLFLIAASMLIVCVASGILPRRRGDEGADL